MNVHVWYLCFIANSLPVQCLLVRAFPGRAPACNSRERSGTTGGLSYSAATRGSNPSTTIVSNDAFMFVAMTGSSGNPLRGSYHGARCATPASTDLASSFPISSPSRGTNVRSSSYLYSCGQKYSA